MSDIDTLANLIRKAGGGRNVGAGLLAERLIAAGVKPPTLTCGEEFDAGRPCVLPPGHRGWHASAPTYSEQDGPQGGAVWTPSRDDSDYQMSR